MKKKHHNKKVLKDETMPTLGYLSMKKVPIITEEWEGYLLAFVVAIAITVTIALLTNNEK